MAVVHSDRGSLDAHARQAIAAAAILATPQTGVVAIILGEFAGDAATLGADKVVVLPEMDASVYQPEREASVVTELIREYRPKHIFLPDNANGDGDLRRRLVAAHGDTSAAHVLELNAEHALIRWNGLCLATSALPQFIILDLGAVDASLPFLGRGEHLAKIPHETAEALKAPCRDLGIKSTDVSQIAIEEADFVVSGGHGVKNVETLKSLARAFGASVGASRVAVDSGNFAKDQQIGATGKTVSASTYIAVGISGAVQHLQGIKDCRHVIAINRDASALIVKRADLTIIGDAEEVMQAMLGLIGPSYDATPTREVS